MEMELVQDITPEDEGRTHAHMCVYVRMYVCMYVHTDTHACKCT